MGGGAAAAPAGNNKQANSSSPKEEVHLNDLPQFSSMHFPVVLQLLAIVIGFFFLCTDYGRPIKPFFIKIPNFWAWADKLGE